ncbi:hypothetical protein GGR54DRAFT_599552 [Hypoxylon sp. NC1633]|nr:hypothetical protein GGR54DRAFT_599552 [Hypoxylon sp. NC1633]
MFEVPDAKRVRRKDLRDSDSDEDITRDVQQDSSLRGKLNEQLSGLLDFSFTTNADVETQQSPEPQIVDAGEDPPDDGSEKSGEEAFTFRLFRGEESSRKVVLEPQSAGVENNSKCAFVVSRRPNSYYFAGEPSPRVANEFKAAAVTADYLLQDAQKRRWGLEKPWKVTRISIITDERKGALDSSLTRETTNGTGKQRKKRPGKKRRIILRTREKAKKEQEDANKRQLVEKEEHLKEKKKRLNRQKKLRQRAKEKEKKQNTKDDAFSEQNM